MYRACITRPVDAGEAAVTSGPRVRSISKHLRCHPLSRRSSLHAHLPRLSFRRWERAQRSPSLPSQEVGGDWARSTSSGGGRAHRQRSQNTSIATTVGPGTVARPGVGGRPLLRSLGGDVYGRFHVSGVSSQSVESRTTRLPGHLPHRLVAFSATCAIFVRHRSPPHTSSHADVQALTATQRLLLCARARGPEPSRLVVGLPLRRVQSRTMSASRGEASDHVYGGASMASSSSACRFRELYSTKRTCPEHSKKSELCTCRTTMSATTSSAGMVCRF